jgi:uncharacterized protein
MSTANPLLKDDPLPQPKPHEPSMEEVLASIRRIITDDQALSASQGGPPNGEALTHARCAHGRGPHARFKRPRQFRPRGLPFNTHLASRFVQQSDVIIGLTREMLRPMLKTWLDDNLPAIVERLVAVEIERVARGE